MKRVFLLVMMIMVSSCQKAPQNYGFTLQPWLGQSQQRLQQAWGIPYNIFYITPNKKVWTYLEVSSHALSNDPYSNEVYYPAISMPDFGYPTQPQYDVHYCKTLFTITEGVVTDYSFNGDDCVVKRRKIF